MCCSWTCMELTSDWSRVQSGSMWGCVCCHWEASYIQVFLCACHHAGNTYCSPLLLIPSPSLPPLLSLSSLLPSSLHSLLFTALLSFFIGLFAVLVTDGKAVWDKGFFQGYSPVVAVVICLQVKLLLSLPFPVCCTQEYLTQSSTHTVTAMQFSLGY